MSAALQRRPPGALPWLVLVCRLAVGIVFVLAGAAKLAAPGSFAAALAAYDVLPPAALRPLTLTLPLVELLVGVWLALGLFTRAAAWAAVALLATFMAAIGQALLRGISLEDCGCFGGLTQAVPALTSVLGGSSLGWRDVARDAIYAALALAVAIGRAAPLSLDRRLGRAPVTTPPNAPAAPEASLPPRETDER
jgi:uncharacterized membrane protein YphA (DoxX/SURF4 family)